MTKPHFFLLFFILIHFGQAQESPVHIDAKIDWEHQTNLISVRSVLNIIPSYFVRNDSIYLYDWNHSYVSKKSPLAESFKRQFDRRFHLANDSDRGYTKIDNINIDGIEVPYERISFDVLALKLPADFRNTKSLSIQINYRLQPANSKFTGYGLKDSEYLTLKNQLILPIPKEDEQLTAHHYWQRGNQRTGIVDYTLRFDPNHQLFIISDLLSENNHTLTGRLASSPLIYISHKPLTDVYTSNGVSLLITKDWSKQFADLPTSLDKTTAFLQSYLAGFGLRPILLSYLDYADRPLVGIDDIPSMISPYPKGFTDELKLIKTLARKYLQLHFDANPEWEQFFTDGFAQYLMEQYVKTSYPDLKLTGKYAHWWPIHNYQLGKLPFNDHFVWLAKYIENRNLDQPLLSNSRELLNYNWQIAHPIRAAQLFSLSIGDGDPKKIRALIRSYQISQFLKPGASAFDLNWYLPNSSQNPIVDRRLLSTRNKNDFTIETSQHKSGIDFLKIKQTSSYSLPVKVVQMQGDSILRSKWVDNTAKQPWVSFPTEPKARYVVNPDLKSPEFNINNNVYNPRSSLFRKPLKVLPLTDLPDPSVSNLFITPQGIYNLYDGIALGLRFSNQAVLNKPFEFQFSPLYSSREKSVIGSFEVYGNQWLADRNRTRITYGVFGASQHFNINSLYSTLTPLISVRRQHPDLNRRISERFTLRYRLVSRSYDREIIQPLELNNPDYAVLNLRHEKSKQSLFDFKSHLIDFQVSNHFIKTSFSAEYRKLFENNTQLSFRLFAGTFLKNNTSDDFFSFGLNGPNDYLYDYDLIGRSESSGFSSQQLIRAEGALISTATDPLADRSLIALNSAINIYRFIELYTELAVQKDKGVAPLYSYGSGIRLNLVTDFLEVYLPVHNQSGFETFDSDYFNRVRVVLALRFETLSRLFTRSLF